MKFLRPLVIALLVGTFISGTAISCNSQAATNPAVISGSAAFELVRQAADTLEKSWTQSRQKTFMPLLRMTIHLMTRS
jgi:hypothetical protein